MSTTTPTGAKITVGYPSLFKATPSEVKTVYRAFMLIGLLWPVIIQFYPTIPNDVKLGVFNFIGCGTALTYTIAQFFGITLPIADTNNKIQNAQATVTTNDPGEEKSPAVGKQPPI